MKHTFQLGQPVHCTAYIVNTGNHYQVIPENMTEGHIEVALYCEQGAKEPLEVTDQHDCARIKWEYKPFDGVYVGKTTVFQRLECSYEEPTYGKDGFRFEKYDPLTVAIVYYAQNRKRLVPLRCVFSKEQEENHG